MEFPKFISQLEEIYECLQGHRFEASCEERQNTSAVATGGPRDILIVQDQHTESILRGIIREVDKLQREYNKQRYRPENTEIVWKGVTDSYYGEVKLWVPPYEEDGSEDGDGTEDEDEESDGDKDSFEFRVASIEVVTNLRWAKDYIALVNINVKKEK